MASAYGFVMKRLPSYLFSICYKMISQKPKFEDKVDGAPCQINKRYHMTNSSAITV